MSNQEAEKLILTLGMPPSINDYYGYRAVNNNYITKYVKTLGKMFLKDVKEYIELNNFDIHANVPLKVEVILNFRTRHKNDLDNRMKPLLDSLTQAGVWEDDSYIDDLHIRRGFLTKESSVIVIIQELTEEEE